MKFEVIATVPFERKFKRLVKKYRSLKQDLSVIIERLETEPLLGVAIGKDCYKIRVAIGSKNKGKSGGARIITYVKVLKNVVYLMDIYDKSDQADISKEELEFLINLFE